MEVKLKNINNQFGVNKALLISFDNRKEFDDFLDLAKEARNDGNEFYKKTSNNDLNKNQVSNIDVFLQKMEQSYYERPNYRNPEKVDCTCMIFSNDFPSLFLAFYDCFGIYSVQNAIFKKLKEKLNI